jgi:hypothetical protein
MAPISEGPISEGPISEEPSSATLGGVGVVPIRYILTGETANVVPVETVLVREAGVVPCRQFVGPANVVPVRETSTEFPRVRVILV